ncbi:hypothetical protein DFH29DRAFT_1083553 [Suillus ampliporus]|nr:hypothetical protein DFH29DRAFT_1083553 [Suillus ampliporus]
MASSRFSPPGNNELSHDAKDTPPSSHLSLSTSSAAMGEHTASVAGTSPLAYFIATNTSEHTIRAYSCHLAFPSPTVGAIGSTIQLSIKRLDADLLTSLTFLLAPS